MKYNIIPNTKPRMTRSDMWKKRPCVVQYWAFKDECRLKSVEVPKSGAHVIFYIPMPKSWSKKKKLLMDGKPHTQRKDVDNLLKALLDAVYDEDCDVWDIRATKLWDIKGAIEINHEEV